MLKNQPILDFLGIICLNLNLNESHLAKFLKNNPQFESLIFAFTPKFLVLEKHVYFFADAREFFIYILNLKSMVYHGPEAQSRY
jgi:hypothetical protein